MSKEKDVGPYLMWNCCRVCTPDTPLDDPRPPTNKEKKMLAAQLNCKPKDIIEISLCPKCKNSYVYYVKPQTITYTTMKL